MPIASGFTRQLLKFPACEAHDMTLAVVVFAFAQFDFARPASLWPLGTDWNAARKVSDA